MIEVQDYRYEVYVARQMHVAELPRKEDPPAPRPASTCRFELLHHNAHHHLARCAVLKPDDL